GGWDRGIAGDPVARKEAARCVDVAPPPKQFVSGARQVNSNVGYCVLGRLIEKRAAMSVDEAARHFIPTARRMKYDDWLGPAGGWSGRAIDYWRFASPPLDARITAQERSSKHAPYGLGWRLEPGGASHFGQFGGN